MSSYTLTGVILRPDFGFDGGPIGKKFIQFGFLLFHILDFAYCVETFKCWRKVGMKSIGDKFHLFIAFVLFMFLRGGSFKVFPWAATAGRVRH